MLFLVTQSASLPSRWSVSCDQDQFLTFPHFKQPCLLARTWSGVPKYLSEIQAIAVHCGGGADPSSSSTSRPFRLSFPFSVLSGASFCKMYYHCGKDLNSHLEVNFVSVMGDLLEDSGDVLFLDAVLEKYHVRNSLKELPGTFRLKKICAFQIKEICSTWYSWSCTLAWFPSCSPLVLRGSLQSLWWISWNNNNKKRLIDFKS